MKKNGNGWINRFLSIIERLGNALPHPATLFAGFAGFILLLSWILSWFNLTVIHPGTGKSVSVVNLVSRLKNKDLSLIIDCGTGDFFIEPNREMHRRLLDARIEHEYTERPGEHNGEYWGNAVDMQVLFFYKFFGG